LLIISRSVIYARTSDSRNTHRGGDRSGTENWSTEKKTERELEQRRRGVFVRITRKAKKERTQRRRAWESEGYSAKYGKLPAPTEETETRV
jgi:hypothetical protein